MGYKRVLKGQSFRLSTWNYGWKARYFVTINTKHRSRYFGEVNNKEMILSDLGLVAQTEWLKIPGIRPDMNIQLDEFIVMPDHIHGIIIIGDNEYNSGGDSMHAITTGTKSHIGTFGPQKKNLGSVIRGYKSAVTTFARKNHLEFNWQSLYYEHIIRNDHAFERIRNYIRNNPFNWKEKYQSVSKFKSLEYMPANEQQYFFRE